MPKMEAKGMCGSCMCGMCSTVCSVLVLLAGVSFLLFGLGRLEGSTAHLVSGVLLGLYGLGMLMHSVGICSKCK